MGAHDCLLALCSSCAEVAGLHAEHVSIDDASVRAVAAELLAAADDVRASVRGLPLPIKFSSMEQEVGRRVDVRAPARHIPYCCALGLRTGADQNAYPPLPQSFAPLGPHGTSRRPYLPS